MPSIFSDENTLNTQFPAYRPLASLADRVRAAREAEAADRRMRAELDQIAVVAASQAVHPSSRNVRSLSQGLAAADSENKDERGAAYRARYQREQLLRRGASAYPAV